MPQGDLLKHNILLIPRYRKYLSQFLLISKWRGNENTTLPCNFRGCLAMQFSRKLRGDPQRVDRADRVDVAGDGRVGRARSPRKEAGRTAPFAWHRAVRPLQKRLARPGAAKPRAAGTPDRVPWLL